MTQIDASPDRMAWLGLPALAALAWFAMGLLGPLTPSSAPPTRTGLVLFFVLPVAIVLASAAYARSRILLAAALFVTAGMSYVLCAVAPPWAWFPNVGTFLKWLVGLPW